MEGSRGDVFTKKGKNIQRLCDILDDNERNLTDLIESLEVN